ncbi:MULTISPECIES: replicative DNA helicase [Bacillus cereus group]|uniref:Replicative DNA helicase n=3 Tax=Bacillus cereus group TaxID=86661 RepID=A0A0J1KP17_BACAN|nr:MULTISPECIES: replicative DNA helicase [Bacillus cereus group]HDR4587711.1 replicative DNA helicase [Bacillus cytotoxicus]HDR7252910.1 replicative DNA helicase [Bacillus pacificus]EOQ19775.1 replicative DNA helicase [Bacillus cereus VD184]KLV18425.1 DNA helicase [Bacillus anthracis]MCC2357683.1 replicative DNA helicase [Bacillus paranthracis]
MDIHSGGIPNYIEAEKMILGSILQEQELIEKVQEVLVVKDFYHINHQYIYEIMLSLFEEDNPIDIISVTGQVQDKNLIDNIPPSYLAELLDTVHSTNGISYYINLVKESSGKRNLHRIAQSIANDAYNSDKDLDEIINQAGEDLAKVSDSQGRDDRMRSAMEIVSSTYEKIELISTHKGDIVGIPTGYSELDRMTSGLNNSDLIIVAARPSVGKTAFALNIAQNVATRSRKNVAIFSLEMDSNQLMMRILCAEGNIDAANLRNGKLTNEEWTKLTMAMGVISNSPLFIDDTPGISIEEIKKKCRKLKRERGLSLVLIDYLQLVTVMQSNKSTNRQEEVSIISKSLKALARELNVPIIALSQLSRGVESRQDKRPMMSDIRESGSIEQDADVVAFLYRDDYYNADTEAKNIIEIIISKQRNGPTGVVELAFIKEFNKFVNLERNFS